MTFLFAKYVPPNGEEGSNVWWRHWRCDDCGHEQAFASWSATEQALAATCDRCEPPTRAVIR